jgi:hypothetical protein
MFISNSSSIFISIILFVFSLMAVEDNWKAYQLYWSHKWILIKAWLLHCFPYTKLYFYTNTSVSVLQRNMNFKTLRHRRFPRSPTFSQHYIFNLSINVLGPVIVSINGTITAKTNLYKLKQLKFTVRSFYLIITIRLISFIWGRSLFMVSY